jgi:hypothetical protein
MLTVSNKGGGSAFNPCPGKTLITVYVTLNPATDYCGEGTPSTINVWVDSSTPTITASAAAGNSIYAESDCTTCAQTGWYKDTGKQLSNSDHYYFKGCTFNDTGNCAWRENVTLRTNVNRDFLCDDVGTLVQDVYLDNNYTEGPDFAGTGNNIYTTHGLYMSPTGSQTADIASAYFRTTNLALEENLSGTYTRFWTDNFGTTGGDFGNPQLCQVEVVEPPTYYQFEVHKSTSWSPADVCDAETVQYYLLEGTAFRDGTRLYSDQSGTNAPNAWYKDAGTSMVPIPDEPEENNANAVFQITNGDGILNITESTCGRSGPREIGG